jgi:acetolactate synthase-1/2/3 large subunit
MDELPLTKGADLIAHSLVALGIDSVFCYPGGANLEILDALSKVAITLIRTEHEQGAVFAAQGYARATGRLGVCLATSGPGATNLVTGIADANSDSVPILAITGNVATRWLGRNAFQEVDIVSITRPITKKSVQVRDPADIAAVLTDAVALALHGRPGPVLVDFPKDIQQLLFRVPTTAALSRQRPTLATGAAESRLSAADVKTMANLLAVAQRPVIYAGGGVIASGTEPLLTRLAEILACPVAVTLMGLGCMDSRHPLFLGPLGMHGAWCANVAVNEADLVLALGVRFDDRVIGDPASFARGATIVHIDVDASELGKNRSVMVGITADLRTALPALIDIARELPTGPWLHYLSGKSRDHPLALDEGDGRGLDGPAAITGLAGSLPHNFIITTGVGQHQMWAMQHVRPHRARSFLSSSGFGTMGFGLPAAIGAKRACPAATVVDIDGDGSLNMTINELGTCRRYGLGVKVFVVNNQWLGMVRQWQDMIYDGNRVVTDLRDPMMETRPGDEVGPYPDFLAIASGYRIRAERVHTLAELDSALVDFLGDPNEPFLLDVMVHRETDVLPMIPSGKTYRDVVFTPRRGCVDDT